uniref:Uncharacterized protein LOC114345896 n=1 Tax=Diabrotica virgifera virgifera TaxID=50390 RepID=A0A6P7GRP7_DIAVI
MLLKLKNKNQTTNFIWVKAHVGIKYNEHVDSLAKAAITASAGIAPEERICIPDTFCISKRNQIDRWKTYWQTFCNHSTTQYIYIQPQIPNSRWFKKFSNIRKYITTLIRLRFGHACYPTHLAKIKIYNSDLCETCQEQGDLNHIFFNCSKYIQHSGTLLSSLQTLQIFPPYQINNLLATNDKR